MTPDLVVWDFDGVLNAEPPSGAFAWVSELDRDLGLSPKGFRALLNEPGLAARVLKGEVLLRDALADWLVSQTTNVTADQLMAHWLAAEDNPDAEVMHWMEQSQIRAVIGTNNPSHRSDYIMKTMGFSGKVERIFASGRMGVAKPDAGFYARIESWSGNAPGRILLIDDNRANINAAAKRGWQTYLFAPHTRDGLPERLGLT